MPVMVGDRVRLIGGEVKVHGNLRGVGGMGIWDPAVSDEGTVTRVDSSPYMTRVEVRPEGSDGVVYVTPDEIEQIAGRLM